MMEISNDQKVLYDYLRKTIRKLTFTYSIDANTMYSALHYYTRPRVKYDMNQYNNIYRRCKNLLKKITLVPADTTAKLLVSPKIFDNAIEEKNIHLYNSMTTPLSYTPVSSILSDSTIMSALSIDNNTAPMDYNATELMFPYAFIGPRNGVNILECSILMMLYKNVYNDKRLDKLNSNIEGNYNYSVAFLNRLIDTYQDIYFIEELSRIFIDSFRRILYKELDLHEDNMFKNYLLAPKYRTRKNLKTAFSSTKHHISVEELESQLQSSYEKLSFSSRLSQLSSEKAIFDDVSIFCLYLIQEHLAQSSDNSENPILEIEFTFNDTKDILLKRGAKDKKEENLCIDESKFNLSLEMANHVLEYISQVYIQSLNVLMELPELTPAMEALFKVAQAAISTKPSE